MKAQSQGQQLNISHIPSNLLTNSMFLNSLPSRVNSWIKAIQVVTKLTRDVSSTSLKDTMDLVPQVQSSNERLSPRQPPLLYRSRQSKPITDTHFLPPNPKTPPTQSVELPLVEAISRDSNDVLLNIPPASIYHLQTAPRTNDGPGNIQDVG